MPVFNGRPYFKAALWSAVRQTYAELEIIVVDDGSLDAAEVAEDVASVASSRVRLVRQPNGGVASALNHAIRLAKGDFFAWLSHDDLFHPEKIERQVAYHGRIGDPNAVLFSNVDFIDADGRTIGRTTFTRVDLMAAPHSALLGSLVNGCTILVPLSVMREAGPFDERLRYTQDYDLWDRIAKRHDFYLQEDRLVSYRLHPEQGTHRPGAAREGDDLWTRMMEGRTAVDHALMDGSRMGFFQRLARHLGGTPYAEAARHARARVSSAVVETVVSVIVCAEHADDRLLPLLLEVGNQDQRSIDLIVACQSIGPTLLALLDSSRTHPVKVASAASMNDAIASAVIAADGDYLCFAEPGWWQAPDRVRLQVERMQRSGTLMSYAPRPLSMQSDPVAPEADSVPMLTVMLHRAVIAAGHELPPFEPGWHWDGLELAHRIGALELDRALVGPAQRGAAA